MDQREDLHAVHAGAARFDQRPGDLEATDGGKLSAGVLQKDGRWLVVARLGRMELAAMMPEDAYALAQELAGMADLCGMEPRRRGR